MAHRPIGVVRVFCTALVISGALAIQLPNSTYWPTDFAPDSIEKIIKGLGFIYESYEVETEDGYIVNLNRMVNPDLNHTTDKGIPILMVNGLLTHGDAWFTQADPKLIIPVRWTLEGYDVWIGDQRGSDRSLKHKTLSAKHWKYWDFSFHETGYYDIPAWIDFILNKTGHDKLAYSGLSDGGATYYVLASTRPEYQEKLYGGILWSPVGEMPPLGSMELLSQMVVRVMYLVLDLLWNWAPWPYLLQDLVAEMYPSNQNLRTVLYYGCKSFPLAVVEVIIDALLSDDCEYPHDQERLCLAMLTALGGTSAKNMLHTAQLLMNGGKFTQYDYGWIDNMYHYHGDIHPPVYNISRLNVFTALYYSDGDIYAKNTSVVHFAHEFSGPVYECQIQDVCHVFALFDPRFPPFLEDATHVLYNMTGRTRRKTGSAERYSGLFTNTIQKCNVTMGS